MQPSKKRELGLIAQEVPFLLTAEEDRDDYDHYLAIDLNKQIMLNSLTNKQLIEKVEDLEKRLNIKTKGKRKTHKRKGRRWRTRH
jgi:hypothetical protein